MSERDEISLPQVGNVRTPRRGFLRGAVEVTASATALGVIATAGGIFVARQEKTSGSLVGKDVEGGGLEQLVTDPFNGEEVIPLRKSPTQSDDGRVWTKPGFEFWAQPEYGVVYYTPQEDIFRVKADGETYGVWYRGAGLPIFKKDEQGILIPVMDENGQQVKSGTVHVAGNYVKKAPAPNSEG